MSLSNHRSGVGRRRVAAPSALALPLLATSLLASGCGVDVEPVEPLPGSKPSATATASGEFVGQWNKLERACPTLDGETAKALELPAVGTPGPVANDNILAQIADCHWGRGPGSVDVLVNINRAVGSPTAEEQTAEKFEEEWNASVRNGETLVAKPEAGIEDAAYIGIHRDRVSVVLAVRSSNARILISYEVAEEMGPDTFDVSLAQHRDTMLALAGDVLDDLR